MEDNSNKMEDQFEKNKSGNRKRVRYYYSRTEKKFVPVDDFDETESGDIINPNPDDLVPFTPSDSTHY